MVGSTGKSTLLALAALAALATGCGNSPLLTRADDGVPGDLLAQWQAELQAFQDQEHAHETVAFLEMRADFLFEHERWGLAFDEYLGLARSGDKFSQYRLARMYDQGLGTGQDLEEAYAWAVIAAESDHETIDAYLLDLAGRVNADPSIDAERLEQRVSEMFDAYSSLALANRVRDQLRDETRNCTGSRIGACFGSTSVASIDSSRDAAAWASITSNPAGGGNALGRLRAQDGEQHYAPMRNRLKLLDSVLEQYRVPAGRVEYGPLMIRDLAPEE